MNRREPHSRSLRAGRRSAAGGMYFVTTHVAGWRPLLDAQAREIVIAALKWLQAGQRITLCGHVIMLDHIHIMFALCEGFSLAQVMNSLMRHTSRDVNRLGGRTGTTFWGDGTHDHRIRGARAFASHLQITHHNPVKAGWVKRPEDYAWSTAHPSWAADINWRCADNPRPSSPSSQ